MERRHNWPTELSPSLNGHRSCDSDDLRPLKETNPKSLKRRFLLGQAALAISMVALSASFPPATRADDTISSRMMASVLPLNEPNYALSTLPGKVWSDQLSRVAQQRGALVASVKTLRLPMAIEAFTATLNTKDGDFVVSALNTGNCWSSSSIPNERECPARLAAVEGDRVKVLTQLDDFPIAMVRGLAGFDASSNEKTSARTEVSYDPKTKVFSYAVFHNGEPSGGPVQFFPEQR